MPSSCFHYVVAMAMLSTIAVTAVLGTAVGRDRAMSIGEKVNHARKELRRKSSGHRRFEPVVPQFKHDIQEEEKEEEEAQVEEEREDINSISRPNAKQVRSRVRAMQKADAPRGDLSQQNAVIRKYEEKIDETEKRLKANREDYETLRNLPPHLLEGFVRTGTELETELAALQEMLSHHRAIRRKLENKEMKKRREVTARG